MKKLILLLLLLPCSLKGEALPSWEWVENMFINKPYYEYNKLNKRLIRWGTTATVTLGTLLALASSKKTMEAALPVTCIAAVFSYFATSKIIFHFIEKHIALKFIEDWPNSKNLVPLAFHGLFDQIYKQKKVLTDAELEEKTQDAINASKLMIYNHFPDKYRHYTHKNASDINISTNNVNWDIARILGTILR